MNDKWLRLGLVCVGVIVVIVGLLVVALTTRDDTGLGIELLGITILLLGISARKLLDGD